MAFLSFVFSKIAASDSVLSALGDSHVEVVNLIPTPYANVLFGSKVAERILGLQGGATIVLAPGFWAGHDTVTDFAVGRNDIVIEAVRGTRGFAHKDPRIVIDGPDAVLSYGAGINASVHLLGVAGHMDETEINFV